VEAVGGAEQLLEAEQLRGEQAEGEGERVEGGQAGAQGAGRRDLVQVAGREEAGHAALDAVQQAAEVEEEGGRGGVEGQRGAEGGEGGEGVVEEEGAAVAESVRRMLGRHTAHHTPVIDERFIKNNIQY